VQSVSAGQMTEAAEFSETSVCIYETTTCQSERTVVCIVDNPEDRRSFLRYDSVLAEIRTGHLPNTSRNFAT
jgi:hypothetical protein